MIDPLFHTGNYQLARTLMDATVLRQQAIAANIANAETPGYRRLDIAPDFATRLKSQFGTGGSLLQDPALRPRLAEDTTASSVRPDGNTVEVERELFALNHNAVEHEFLSEIVSNSIKQLKMAIAGRQV
jgi:flagellar basal-body rod protein FlgB